MQNSNVPFNIVLLVLSKEILSGLRPVTSMEIFDKGDNFHDEGLFSTTIFGRVGDEIRDNRFSYINIGIEIFHPLIFDSLSRLRSLYTDIISGKEYAIWNEATCDFDKATALTGSTGFHFFISHWKELKLQRSKSDIRNQMISLIEKYKEESLLDKVVVIPAGMRDMEISKAGRMEENEINPLYRKLLAISGVVTESAIRNNPEILNNSRYSLQLTFNQIYQMLEAMINGKHKLILGKWATRRIFNTTRNVASSMDTAVEELGAEGNVGINNTIIGLYQVAKTFLPVVKYYIRHGFLKDIFINRDQPVYLVNKTTLKSEPVKLNAAIFDRWCSDGGVEELINSFANDDVRNKPVEIENHYLGLMYKGPDMTFKMITDIDDIPEERDKKDVSPITLCQLLYCSIYKIINKYPIFVTRYPITGVGSIYPSMVHLRTTVVSEKRVELGNDWEPMPNGKAFEFPTLTNFVNTLVPHGMRCSGMGLDLMMFF